MNYAALLNNAKIRNVNHLSLLIKLKQAISKKRQALKRFEELTTAFNKTRRLKASRKTSYTVKEAKCNRFSKIFSFCINKPKKFYRPLNEMTDKGNVKTNLMINNKINKTKFSPTLIADMLNKKFDNFPTTVEGPATKELKECSRKIHLIGDNLFSIPSKMT